jgi:hypothetical protein
VTTTGNGEAGGTPTSTGGATVGAVLAAPRTGGDPPSFAGLPQGVFTSLAAGPVGGVTAVNGGQSASERLIVQVPQLSGVVPAVFLPGQLSLAPTSGEGGDSDKGALPPGERLGGVGGAGPTPAGRPLPAPAPPGGGLARALRQSQEQTVDALFSVGDWLAETLADLRESVRPGGGEAVGAPAGASDRLGPVPWAEFSAGPAEAPTLASRVWFGVGAGALTLAWLGLLHLQRRRGTPEDALARAALGLNVVRGKGQPRGVS